LYVHSLKRCGEHVEKCLLDADNAVNLYGVAHDFATTGEHKMISQYCAPHAYELASPRASAGIRSSN
jgi:hypothetical protein